MKLKKNKNDKNKMDHEDKTELAQIIAEQSEKISKRYASLWDGVMRVLNWFSSWVDRILFNPRHGVFVAFGLALLVYLAFNQNVTGAITSFSTKVTDVPVNVNFNTEMYEVSGYDETIDLTLVGDYSDVSMVNPQDDFQVELDLRGYSEGTHQVTYKVSQISPRVRAFTEPGTATITIAAKQARTMQLSYDFINQKDLGSQYVLGEPVLSQRDVTIKASNETMDKISFVRALIDVGNQTTSFETEAKIVAYDENGELLKSVDIIPSTVNVSVVISSPNKVVPIKPVFEGVIPDGKAVKSLSMNYEAMTIYAPQSVLDKITQISFPIKASTLTSDTKFVHNIVLPSGVRHGTVSKVSVDLKLGEGESRVFEDVIINYRNNVNHLSLAIVSKDEPYTNLEIFGTKENLDDFDIDNVFVYVDLRSAEVGENQTFPLFVEYLDGKSGLYTIKTSDENVSFNVIKQ